MRESMRVSDSRTTQTFILMPSHMNPAGSIFGGQLLSWIDMISGIVAMRHTDSKVVTAAIDHLDFKESAFVSDVLTMDARVTWVGNTSLEVRVDSYRENKGGEKHLINTAFLVMVAIDDETRQPIRIPRLAIETPEEQAEFEAGEKRALLRKQRRKENF